MEGEGLEQKEIPLLKALAVVGCLKRVDSTGRFLDFMMSFVSQRLNLSLECVRYIWIHRNTFYPGLKGTCTKEEMQEINIDWRILVLNKRCQTRRRVKSLCLKKRRCNEVQIPDPKLLDHLTSSSSNHSTPSFSVQTWEAFKQHRNSKNLATGKRPDRPDLWKLEKELMQLLGGYERTLMEGEHLHEKEVEKDDSIATPVIASNSQFTEKSVDGDENSSKESVEKEGSSNEEISKGSSLEAVNDAVSQGKRKKVSTNSKLCKTRTQGGRGMGQRVSYKRRKLNRKERHCEAGFTWNEKIAQTPTPIISVSNTDDVLTPVTPSSQGGSSGYSSKSVSPAQVNDCTNTAEESCSTGVTQTSSEETTQTTGDNSEATQATIIMEISKDPELGPVFRSFFRDFCNNNFSNQDGIDDIQFSADGQDFDDSGIPIAQEDEIIDFDFTDLMGFNLDFNEEIGK
ncbi:unnamed protein product [Orchesella dallaii]|uniref:Uncharacterized protein n=1 Tax=Orchesella dallaii TaxID=48710 RepID=A0ABP1S1F5_9HEXA